jgi:hypothetical protein
VARAQSEITALQQQLREVEASRLSVEESRRRISTIDSVLRALRNIERARQNGDVTGYAYSYPAPVVAYGGNFATTVAPNVNVVTVPGRVYPLRYSRDLRNTRIEARAPGPVSVNEMGDSTVVVTANGVEVKIQLLPRR